MAIEQESSIESSFGTSSQWPQEQKNNKKFQQRNKVARMLLFSKKILIFIMIGFTSIHSNFSIIGKEGNFNEARGKKRQRSERSNSLKHDDGLLGENKTKVINAIQKMYNGGHLNRDFAKYILLQGKDMMAQLPSFLLALVATSLAVYVLVP